MPASKSARAYSSLFHDVAGWLINNEGESIELPYEDSKEARNQRSRFYYFRKACVFSSKKDPVEAYRTKCHEYFVALNRYVIKVEERDGTWYLKFVIGTENYTKADVSSQDVFNDFKVKHLEDKKQRELNATTKTYDDQIAAERQRAERQAEIDASGGLAGRDDLSDDELAGLFED